MPRGCFVAMNKKTEAFEKLPGKNGKRYTSKLKSCTVSRHRQARLRPSHIIYPGV